MQVSFSARHGTLSPESQEHMERKLPKLTHILDRLTSIQVTTDFQFNEPEVELLVSAEHKHDFVAKERGVNVLAAFDSALEKMESQLRRYKEKIQDHRKSTA